MYCNDELIELSLQILFRLMDCDVLHMKHSQMF